LNNTLLNDQWVYRRNNGRTQKFLELNENENTTCQKLWDTAKAVLRGKFIAMSTYIKNTEISSNQMPHLKLLEDKKEQHKYKTSTRREIIKIGIESMKQRKTTTTKFKEPMKQKLFL
jgi:hypothetical protein